MSMRLFQTRYFLISVSGFSLVLSSYAEAISRASAQDQAKRLYERMVGVNPSNAALKQMTDLVESGRVEEASFYAMDDLNFYKITVKQMFNALSNQVANSDLPLNDSTALAIGLIRDNESFDQILYADALYTGPDDLSNYAGLKFKVNRGTPSVLTDILATQSSPLVSPPELNRTELANPLDPNNADAPVTTRVRPLIDGNSNVSFYRDNLHYEDLQSKYSDWPSRLIKRTQSGTSMLTNANGNYRIPAEDVAGVITTRQVASEFFAAGTNRRMFKFIALNYLCKSMEQLHDSDAADDMVRSDVDRKPGGSNNNYLNTCKGCHAGLDAFTAAFAFLDYKPGANDQNALIRLMGTGSNFSFAKTISASAYPAFPYAISADNKQYRQANIYPDGFNPIKMQANQNKWENRWATGPNAQKFGWRIPPGMSSYQKGKGANSLGRVLAATEAFSACMVRKVFQKVCFRSPALNEASQLKALASGFENGFSEFASHGASGKYNMKSIFAKTASICFGH